MNKNHKRKTNADQIMKQMKTVEIKVKDGVFIFSGPLTVSEFSDKIKQPATKIITHFFKLGKMANINYLLNEEEIAELCIEFGLDFKKEKEVNASNFMEEVKIVDDEKDLKARPPIITIMGHVDHGKTTLIDNIRNSNITSGEAGGITQHTGAYQIEHNGKKITFLDTPGHEAFTEMRARGAKVTDIVVLVVAGDDGVMPQTKEAIEHAKVAKVPIIVFVNKMDKQIVDKDRILAELSKEDVVSEEWGGDVQFIYGSGLTGLGVDKLFEAINIQAEMLELKANPNRYAIGSVIESRIDKGMGTVATVIVQNGSLFQRDFVVAGSNYGRVRMMTNSKGETIEKAFPGDPVIITGLNYTPNAGDKFVAFHDEKQARQLADEKKSLDRDIRLSNNQAIQMEDGRKIYNVMIKSDVQGTAEAVKNALSKIENDEVKVNVVRAAIGNISKSDILLASASKASIFTFNIKPTPDIRKEASDQGIIIHSYDIIYKMVEEVEKIIKSMKKPVWIEKIIGHAQVMKVIFASKIGNIAGSRVMDGEIRSDSKIRVIRNGKIIEESKLDSLQRGPDSVKSVKTGYEFGCHVWKFDEIKVDDVLEAYIEELKVD